MVAVVGWPHAVDDAIAERQDLPVVSVRTEGSDPTYALRRRNTERNVRIVEPWDATLTRVAFLLVPALAIGPVTALVPAGVGALIDELGRNVRDIWLVGGVGRVLPARALRRGRRREPRIRRVRRDRRPRARGLLARTVRPRRGSARCRAGDRRDQPPRLPRRPRAAAPAQLSSSDVDDRRAPRAVVERSVVAANGHDAEAPAQEVPEQRALSVGTARRGPPRRRRSRGAAAGSRPRARGRRR